MFLKFPDIWSKWTHQLSMMHNGEIIYQVNLSGDAAVELERSVAESRGFIKLEGSL